MPKNRVADLITDQEIAFARLVLSGAMTDRQAAETAGLNPETPAAQPEQPLVKAHKYDSESLPGRGNCETA